jgi:DNA-binding NarL/FixJ family response regulator
MVQTEQLAIAIIEDHQKIRNGMEYLIRSHDGFSCRAYENAEVAIADFRLNKPDIVLMDIGLPGMDGIACTQLIKSEFPDVLIMMCTVYEDDEKIFRALSAGASGYILKRSAGDHLIQSIKELHDGGAPMSSTIAKKVVVSFQKQDASAKESPLLTDRENEVLDLLAQGFRNKEIAAHLFVSVNTIRTHIYNIYEKLHVQNRVEALNKTGRR